MGDGEQVFDHLPTHGEVIGAWQVGSTGVRRPSEHRPSVPWGDAMPHAVALAALCMTARLPCSRGPWCHARKAAIVVSSALALASLKGVLVFLIMVYQRHAPARVRDQCCFEPSCSEYMRLAIKQYGARRGVAKGIARLLRCGPPGGVDCP